MKLLQRSRVLLLLVGTLALGWSAAAALQEDDMPPAVKPTEQHALLKRMAGTWDAKVSMMGMTSKGTYVAKTVMGGLWSLGDYTGEFMGQPFQGHAVDGYDPEKGKYVSIWVDSMSSAPQFYEGTYDAERDVLTYEGYGISPMTGEHVPEVHRLSFHGSDGQTFEMIQKGPDGADMLLMTIEYTRRK